jgi:hypothetical protein
MALAHEVEIEVEAAYRRGNLFEKPGHLMQAWADYCSRPSAPAGFGLWKEARHRRSLIW